MIHKCVIHIIKLCVQVVVFVKYYTRPKLYLPFLTIDNIYCYTRVYMVVFITVKKKKKKGDNGGPAL